MTVEERAERERRRAKRAKALKKRRTIAAACFLGLVVVAGIFLFPLFSDNSQGAEGNGQGIGGFQKEEPVLLTISCVGDIMAHQTQIQAQYDSASDTYNFENNFQYVKKYIEKADLALCNVETTFKGGKPTGYPLFNAPDALAGAIKNAGFDVAITANNHMMDTGFSGMQRTLEILRGAELTTTGSKYEGEKAYSISEVKGVKVAVVAYTYETPMVNGRRTINGNYLSDEARALVNSFSYSSLEADLKALQQNIDSAKTDGAEIIICYFHWGEEYQRTPNDWQTSIARKAADMGADVIFASHPHVLQDAEMLTIGSEGEGQEEGLEQEVRQVPVFYSMGNFISNQRAETLDNNRYTEQGMIANVHLTYDKNEKKISAVSMDAMPTWVERYKKGGKMIYSLIPLDDEMGNNPELKASGHGARAKQALEDVKALLLNCKVAVGMEE